MAPFMISRHGKPSRLPRLQAGGEVKYSCRVYFKDDQVKGNTVVHVTAQSHSEAAIKANKAVVEFFKSSPVEILKTDTRELKGKKK